jgi:hypothetical protein
LVPVIVTVVPPPVGPADGLIAVTVGATTYPNWSAEEVAEVPPAVVTVMSTVAAEWAGAVAVICVAELTVKLVAAVPPKLTAVAPVKLVPVIVTDPPPAVVPLDGLTPVTVGGATKRYWSAEDVSEVPAAFTTVTSTVPAECAGAVAVIEVAELIVKLLAAVVPKLTAVA